MSNYRCDLRSFLLDSIEFMIEQTELARLPNDQVAAVDAAGGIVPFIKARLSEDHAIASPLILVLQELLASEQWAKMARDPSEAFLSKIDNILDRLRAAKKTLETAPQSH
jgi:hypothetical protein